MIRRMNINQSVKITNDHFCIFSDSSLISVDPWRLTQAEIRLNHHRLSPPTLHSFIHSRWNNLAAQFFRSSRRRRSDQTVSVQAISHRTNQHWQDRSGCSSSSSLLSTTFFLKKQLDLISLRCSVLLSCQSHPHEPRGADWPDRHLLHSGPGVNSSSSLPHAAATSFSCVKDEDRLTLQAWSSGEMLQTPHLKAAETSNQTANIMEWWRENLEILIDIFVHNASWFVQNCSTSNCWEKVWICFHTEVKYSWKYSVLQVVDTKKTLHNNVPILLFDRFMLNKNELKVNDTHVYSFNS